MINTKGRSFKTKAIAFLSSFAFIAIAMGISVALAAITFSNTSITGDSSFNTITGATSTSWDLGTSTATLSLQTLNNGPITTGNGLFTFGGNISVTGTSAFAGIMNVTNIDRAGTIAIGTSSATGITIGRANVTLTIPGSLLVSATSTFSGILGVSNIDQAGTISIGTSSASTVNIGKSGSNVVFPGNTSTTGTLTVGSAGTPIVRFLSSTSSLTFGIIASTTCAVQTMTVTNASSTTFDTVVASPYPVATGVDTASTTWSAWVSANNTVSIRVCNPTGSNTASLAAQVWRADVWQH